MSDLTFSNGTDPAAAWEAQVAAVARHLPYPPTPNLVPAVQVRLRLAPKGAGWTRAATLRPAPRLAWAAALVLVLALLAVPGVRAGLVALLQIGSVRLVFSPTAAPTAAATVLPSVLDLDGRTTLDEARDRVDYALRLPTYPPDLGPPDAAFVQASGRPTNAGTTVVLVWLEPGDPESARLVLQYLDSATVVFKDLATEAGQLQWVQVNGREAAWVQGTYNLRLQRDGQDVARLINGQVLIWTDDQLTYRLETSLPLEEAIRVAESLE